MVDPLIIVPQDPSIGTLLATHQEIAAFLADVERRAFKQAMFAVRDQEAALDIVQDAMLRLTEKYGHLPVGELPMLFQRILQNTIHDHFRRQKVRSTWTVLLSAFGDKGEKDEDYDPLDAVIGICKGGPRDGAENHDKYIYGDPHS